MDGEEISFGPFRLHISQRLLIEGDRPVRLGGRAFDILAGLVERAGEVVGKEQLIARAWPESFVEESNLKIQISALRRVLGDGQGGNRYVITVPGRGYNFVAPVRREKTLRAASSPAASTTPHNLPFAVSRMIGRDDAVAALVRRLSQVRLATIVGAGGIGKTTLALAVAERMMTVYDHGIWLVDLAPLADPSLVPSAVAAVLSLEIRTESPLHYIATALRDKRMLLLLDNCEHVIVAAADLAAAILAGARGVNILATSREPLGAAGEGEYRLAPLALPKASSRLTPAEAAHFPAVQLFVERVNAVVDGFALTDANTPAVADICRKLDGLPLAIELAAPRVEALGLEGLAAHLNDTLQMLGGRRRTSAPRQRTMRAVIDWSYCLLSADEQLFFRALGIFRGTFTIEAAASVARDGADTGDTINRLADLVAKSLAVPDIGGAKPRFWLLDTTRAYALEKLDAGRERQRIASRHAEYYLALLERAGAEAPVRPAAEWLTDYAMEIDNLRTALDWGFSPAGDISVGIALTTAAVPLWMRLSLHEECRGRVEQALGALETLVTPDPREVMKLHTALGAAASREPGEKAAAFRKVLEIAEILDDSEHRLLALRGLYHYSIWANQFPAARSFAQRFYDLAASNSNQNDRIAGQRQLGTSKFHLGDLAGARRDLEQALSGFSGIDGTPAAIRFDDVIRFQYDGQVETRVFLANVLWRQGFPDQALRMAEQGLAEAQAIGHVYSQCLVLSLALCPLALWIGDLSIAADYTRLLGDISAKYGQLHWAIYVARYRRVIELKGGDADSIEASDQSDAHLRSLVAGAELVEALAGVGRSAEGLAVLDQLLVPVPELGGSKPEFLRLRGELLLLQTPTNAILSGDLFRRALDIAHEQGALSWELRAATSLARLLRDQGRQAEAIACLRPIYGHFTEGFDTVDLIAAKRLLDELSGIGRGECGALADGEGSRGG